MVAFPLEELTAAHGPGPLGAVLPISSEDEAALRQAFDQAGRKTVTSVASALSEVFHWLTALHQQEHTHRAAVGRLRAGETSAARRPGRLLGGPAAVRAGLGGWCPSLLTRNAADRLRLYWPLRPERDSPKVFRWSRNRVYGPVGGV